MLDYDVFVVLLLATRPCGQCRICEVAGSNVTRLLDLQAFDESVQEETTTARALLWLENAYPTCPIDLGDMLTIIGPLEHGPKVQIEGVGVQVRGR